MSIFQDADIADTIAGFLKPFELHSVSLVTRVYRDACTKYKEEYRRRPTVFTRSIPNTDYRLQQSVETTPFETIDYEHGRLQWTLLVYPKGNTTNTRTNFVSVYLKPLFNISLLVWNNVSFQLFDHEQTRTLRVPLFETHLDWGFREWGHPDRWSKIGTPIEFSVRFIPNTELLCG